MASKQKSAFDDLIAARRSPSSHSDTQSPDHLVTQSPSRSAERVSKSKDANYTRLTFYIRKDTDMQLRQKLLRQEKRELSDVFQKLAEGWIAGQFDV